MTSSGGDRTRIGRARAEDALVRFALLAGNRALDVVVIGGLNPDFLAEDAPLEHAGTTDLDILLEVGAEFDRDDLDFGWLASLFAAGGFERSSPGGWEWDARLGDSSVRVQLVCDDRSRAGQDIALPGARGVAARSFAGPGAMLDNPVVRRLPVSKRLRAEAPGSPEHVELRFASLGGYIISKAFAWESSRGRRAKDAYDLLFVILHCVGGPTAAAEAVAAVPLGRDRVFDRSRVPGALADFADPAGMAAGHYASAMRDTGDPELTLRNDAAFGVRTFLNALSRLAPHEANGRDA